MPSLRLIGYDLKENELRRYLRFIKTPILSHQGGYRGGTRLRVCVLVFVFLSVFVEFSLDTSMVCCGVMLIP